MFSRDLTLAKYDADLFAAMQQEAQRQEDHIELIASENYTSPAPTTPTSSRTPAPRPTPPSTWPCSAPVTPFLA